MKCPNCGAEMPEDVLYCEKCGGDIHIVPDFDPILEYNMSRSISNLINDEIKQDNSGKTETEESFREYEQAGKEERPGSGEVFGDEERFENEGMSGEEGIFWNEGMSGDEEELLRRKEEEEGQHRRRTIRFVLIAVGVCILGLAAAGTFTGIRLYQYHSYDYQLKKAAECLAQEDYARAVGYYKRAVEIDDTDIETEFALAGAYLKLGNKIEYEYLLREIIRNPNVTQEQLERAYGRLIAIYGEREDYNAINEILNASDNEAILNAYEVYLAEPPEFNYEAGYYNKMVPLKLTSCTKGKIYYTIDGTQPTSDSPLYTAPILLEENTVVKAIFINEYGIVSDVASREFHVEIELEDEPQISVISGDYSVPMLIEVTDRGNREVYYTMDGSHPDLHSNLYTGPIPMPLGSSQFKFAYVGEDGTSSKVAERSYRLRLQTDVTVEDAEALVVEYMLILKKIYNEEGFFSTSSAARYLYKYQNVVSVENEGDFYVIAEIYRNEEGIQDKTGSYYAVNIYNKECYKLLINGNNNYTLVEILIEDSQDEG